jgi:isopenicillin-N N-acyltransferase like protein
MEGWPDVERSSRRTAPAADALPIVECLSIDGRDRGRAHGESLRTPIREKIARWHGVMEGLYGQPAPSFIARFLAQTQFRSAIERHTPELMQEVIGIAEGAGVDTDTIYALQLMDEEWCFVRAALEGHCSCAGAGPRGGNPTVMGQTMDLPAWHDGAQALLRLQERDGSQTLVFTSAGMIGLMGLAGRGLGVCVNTLFDLHSRPDGLPVAFVVRGALSRQDAADAARFLREVPHASGQNYLVADAGTVRAFECSAAEVCEIAMQNGLIVHTNHALGSADRREQAVASENSKARFESLEAECRREPAVRADLLKTALASRRADAEISIARLPGAQPAVPMTVGGVVYEIGSAVRFWTSIGPPTSDSWREASVAQPNARLTLG